MEDKKREKGKGQGGLLGKTWDERKEKGTRVDDLSMLGVNIKIKAVKRRHRKNSINNKSKIEFEPDEGGSFTV